MAEDSADCWVLSTSYTYPRYFLSGPNVCSCPHRNPYARPWSWSPRSHLSRTPRRWRLSPPLRESSEPPTSALAAELVDLQVDSSWAEKVKLLGSLRPWLRPPPWHMRCSWLWSGSCRKTREDLYGVAHSSCCFGRLWSVFTTISEFSMARFTATLLIKDP